MTARHGHCSSAIARRLFAEWPPIGTLARQARLWQPVLMDPNDPNVNDLLTSFGLIGLAIVRRRLDKLMLT